MMFQAGLAKFDVKTETFQLFPVQSELNIDTTQQSMLTPSHWKVDGKVWTNDVHKQAVLRLDVATGKYEVIDPFKVMPKGRQHSPYGMVVGCGQQSVFHGFRRRERRTRSTPRPAAPPSIRHRRRVRGRAAP